MTLLGIAKTSVISDDTRPPYKEAKRVGRNPLPIDLAVDVKHA